MAAAKKVIAICQSGGEFRTSKDGTLIYKGGEAYAIDLDETTQLGDFKREVAETFRCDENSFSIKYFLPGNKSTPITISKDKDLNRMVSFLGDAATVDVFVIHEDAPQLPGSRSSTTPVKEPAVALVVPAPTAGAAADAGSAMSDQMEMDVVDGNQLVSVPSPLGEGKLTHKGASQWENIITGVDQRFNSFNDFREALHKFSIAHGFAYKYKKNDSHRVTVKCKSSGCPWRIYASKLSTTQLICIKKMNATHTCEGGALKPGYRATRGWVGNMIKEKLKTSPHYKPKDIAEDIEREYGIHLNYSQAWRAKEIAREQLQGSSKDAYSQLPYFCEKIKETNPGSFATFTTKDDSSFHRLFVAFHASITGFRLGCRPLLFLNGYPLNSRYQGMLLAATAVDANDDVFPVAFAVVDSETDENWHWFLVELKSAVSASQKITFVADFQKGLKESLAQVFSDNCYHAYCIRCLTEKLNKDLKGHFSHEARRFMINDFYAAAYAPSLEAFEKCTENIKGISPEAYDWVIKSEPDHWSNAFFEGARYNNLMASNFGQEFYSWVSEANELPITQMVDVLRGRIMEIVYARRVESSQWTTVLTPPVEEKLQKEISVSQSLQVLPSLENKFEVRGESIETVDIFHWDCTCRVWQLTGIPCCHALAALGFSARNAYEYCSNYFTVESYRLTYAETIHPVPSTDVVAVGETTQALVTVTPPPTKRPPGRPKSKQTEVVDVMKRQLQCSKCKGLGHNKKTCKTPSSDVAADLSMDVVVEPDSAGWV